MDSMEPTLSDNANSSSESDASPRTLIKRFHILQEERVETYKLFEEYVYFNFIFRYDKYFFYRGVAGTYPLSLGVVFWDLPPLSPENHRMDMGDRD